MANQDKACFQPPGQQTVSRHGSPSQLKEVGIVPPHIVPAQFNSYLAAAATCATASQATEGTHSQELSLDDLDTTAMSLDLDSSVASQLWHSFSEPTLAKGLSSPSRSLVSPSRSLVSPISRRSPNADQCQSKRPERGTPLMRQFEPLLERRDRFQHLLQKMLVLQEEMSRRMQRCEVKLNISETAGNGLREEVTQVCDTRINDLRSSLDTRITESVDRRINDLQEAGSLLYQQDTNLWQADQLEESLAEFRKDMSVLQRTVDKEVQHRASDVAALRKALKSEIAKREQQGEQPKAKALHHALHQVEDMLANLRDKLQIEVIARERHVSSVAAEVQKLQGEFDYLRAVRGTFEGEARRKILEEASLGRERMEDQLGFKISTLEASLRTVSGDVGELRRGLQGEVARIGDAKECFARDLAAVEERLHGALNDSRRQQGSLTELLDAERRERENKFGEIDAKVVEALRVLTQERHERTDVCKTFGQDILRWKEALDEEVRRRGDDYSEFNLALKKTNMDTKLLEAALQRRLGDASCQLEEVTRARTDADSHLEKKFDDLRRELTAEAACRAKDVTSLDRTFQDLHEIQKRTAADVASAMMGEQQAAASLATLMRNLENQSEERSAWQRQSDRRFSELEDVDAKFRQEIHDLGVTTVREAGLRETADLCLEQRCTEMQNRLHSDVAIRNQRTGVIECALQGVECGLKQERQARASIDERVADLRSQLLVEVKDRVAANVSVEKEMSELWASVNAEIPHRLETAVASLGQDVSRQAAAFSGLEDELRACQQQINVEKQERIKNVHEFKRRSEKAASERRKMDEFLEQNLQGVVAALEQKPLQQPAIACSRQVPEKGHGNVITECQKDDSGPLCAGKLEILRRLHGIVHNRPQHCTESFGRGCKERS